MSEAPQLRRVDKVMTEERAHETLRDGFCGRLATVGLDGWPYIVPLLYVVIDGEIVVHNASARGHLRTNVDANVRVCFEVDEPGEVFAYGRFECDSSVSDRSVIAFGAIRIVDDLGEKARFGSALMKKYGREEWGRPRDCFPRLDEITIYAITVERMTGKETALPDVSGRWPALDRTRSPGAIAPSSSRRRRACPAKHARWPSVTVGSSR